MAEWQIQVQGFKTEGSPTISSGGRPSGEPAVLDIDVLLDALCELAAAGARKLNQLEMENAPSEFTLDGHVAVQVTGGIPVLQFGVETGIGVSLTWTFERQEVVIKPKGRRIDELGRRADEERA